ncbi:NADPH-dependent FMN reductase [Massilia sp. CCM 9210]|uniref:NADPH-dependent FMN reductase n=1 Tax=Massilia scottii TaxID=3057166 RepID=UPI002796B8A0|nr:NADPH-dependent FMN reductase [Massilia sp. CCM 9210]MDQ1812433.1 NADPH-dependent FMN reductase [Massilia sp. CCM 9210]
MTRLVAVSGSLRRESANTTLLRAAIALAPSDIAITLYEGVGDLPQFNPDIEHDAPPLVQAWRALLRDCDGIVVACPEYVHGVPGAFKNALDWVVGSTELAGKRVALINASGRAVHCHAALVEIITTMGWIVVDEASPVIPVAGKNYTQADMIGNPALAEPLLAALHAMAGVPAMAD